MTLPIYKEILERAILRAETHGLKHKYIVSLLTISNYNLIFNHDFAKALWGEGKTIYRVEVIESPTEGEAGFDEYYEAWQYHLQNMVIADDPIKYLGEHLP